MDSELFSNPYVLTIGFLLVLFIVLFWNRKNQSVSRIRRQRSFRDNYFEKKKEREETED